VSVSLTVRKLILAYKSMPISKNYRYQPIKQKEQTKLKIQKDKSITDTYRNNIAGSLAMVSTL